MGLFKRNKTTHMSKHTEQKAYNEERIKLATSGAREAGIKQAQQEHKAKSKGGGFGKFMSGMADLSARVDKNTKGGSDFGLGLGVPPAKKKSKSKDPFNFKF